MPLKRPPEAFFSIRIKIFLGILVPTIILVLVALMDYRGLTLLGRSSERILSENYNSIKAAQEIREHLETARNELLLRIFGYERAWSAEPSVLDRIAALLAFCGDNITEPEERPVLQRINTAFGEYRVLFERVVSSVDLRKPDGNDKDIVRFISQTAMLINNLNDLVLINERAMERAQLATNRFARKALQSSVGVLAAALVCTVIISLMLSRHLSRPLTGLAEALSSVKEGSGHYPVLEVTTRDEIGFLTAEFNRLFERLKTVDRLSASKLLAEQEKVHQSETAKARFIADLSHQLKTPMTSLSMSVGLLSERGDRLAEEKRVRLLRTAREDCMRLAALINELVDIAKLESMVVPRPKEFLEIHRVIEETLRPLTTQAEEKGVRLEIRADRTIPPLAIDSLRFPWVLTNLVGNAIRYTDRGGAITLTAMEKAGRCLFTCTDTGSGIDARFLSNIFDRYSQFSEREKSGTIGLGLAIVKEIIEQHGGDISVQSRVGQGTAFHFWIPVRPAED